MENHTDKEKVRFLKDEYGIGGRSHALSGATHSGEDHDGKGPVSYTHLDVYKRQVEGNSGDACKIKRYDLNYQSIKGYGLMNW